MSWTLVTKTWRDHWRGLVAWMAGLIAIVAVELWVYPSVRDSAAGLDTLMATFPEAFQQFFRMGDYTSPTGFLNVEVFSLIVPLVLIAVGISWGAGTLADEEDKGTADILLTLPISRTSVVIAKVTATVVVLLALAATLAASLAVGGLLVDLGIALDRIAAACLASTLLALLYASVSFLIAAMTGRKAVAIGVAIGLALAGYLAYSLSPMLETLENLNPVNPFQWALGPDPLANGMDPAMSLRLVVISAILLVVTTLAYRRRDIRSA